ncbi:MAG TPA: class I SAM-dependent methyltransferase [Pirellulales bacterium]|nr:class I SAM-dependent methyltransferase [Pirellulales bacterium]
MHTSRSSQYGQPFLDFDETITAANAAKQEVGDYLETLWGCVGQATTVVEEMLSHCELTKGISVLEIGPGSGRFLKHTLDRLESCTYEIYETAPAWERWLYSTFKSVIARAADGISLSQTESGSCHLVHAHGVFVYVPLLVSFSYFREMMRVCRPGGYVVFDMFPEDTFDSEEINKWLQTPERFPVVLPRGTVEAWFSSGAFYLVHQFNRRVGPGQAQYLIFKKKASYDTG